MNIAATAPMALIEALGRRATSHALELALLDARANLRRYDFHVQVAGGRAWGGPASGSSSQSSELTMRATAQ